MAFIKRAKRPFTSFTNDPRVSKKIHSSIIAVSLWSLTTIHWAHSTRSSIQALEPSSSFRDSQCGRKGSAAPALRCAKDRLGKRGTSWGRLSQLREAGWENGGGRGRSCQRLLAKKREPSLRLGPRPAPRRKPARSDHPGETRLSGFPWPPGIPETPPLRYAAAGALPYPAARQLASRSPRRGAPLPTPRSVRPRRSAASRKPGFPRIPSPRRLPPPPSSHLRGAPIAELVGDGLDAPGPGHRDVAALRAYVQPHHRHGRLSVRLLLGSV